MYENNYPNNYGSSNTENSSVNYQPNTGNTFGSANASENTYHYEQNAAPKPNKPKKAGTGIGRKIALGICCGLLFGVFAGLGFEAVTTASDFVKEKTQVETSVEPKAKEISQTSVEETVTKETENTIAETNASQMAVQTTVTDVTEVVKAVMPAVVSVNNKFVTTTSFWGQQYSSEGSSTGSGIIVGQNDTELLLVTNYHVVEEAEELSVQFADGTQAQAQIKGSDADKDLAVIAVQLDDIDSATQNAIAIAKLGD